MITDRLTATMTCEQLKAHEARIRVKTPAELDELCGGRPTHYAECDLCPAHRGPYYSASAAAASLDLHKKWVHGVSGR